MFSRKLGDSELSYFLPSRADGVNDMYLHLGFRAPQSIVNPHRVAVAWAILRLRHPLLAARVAMEPGEYDTARFVYIPPTSTAAALVDAQSTLLLNNSPKDVLIDTYLNGPRTLSNECISLLILSSDVGPPSGIQTPPGTPRPSSTEFNTSRLDNICEFDLLFCAAHFLGDGIALHTCVNDLFTLLAGHSASVDPEASASGVTTTLSDTALHILLELEWSKRWARGETLSSPDTASPDAERTSTLPPPLEDRLPGSSVSASVSPLSKFQRVAHDLAFRRAQGRLIGGHAFARVPRPSLPHSESSTNIVPRRQCHTLVRTVAFPPALTRRVLKQCKEEGVSVAHVLFALCNVAWGRIASLSKKGDGSRWAQMPMMMYSALNLRPYLMSPPPPSLTLRPGDASYWFLAVGYFNVVLPAFLLPPNGSDSDSDSSISARRTLFHRARLSKRQCASAAKTPLLEAYALRMARERGGRAKRFAREDDGLLAERDRDGMSKSPSASGGQTAGRIDKRPDCPAPKHPQAPLSPPTTPMGTRPSTPPSTTVTTNETPGLPEPILQSLPEILPQTNKTSPTPPPDSLPPPSKITTPPGPSNSNGAPPPTTAPSNPPPSTALLGLSLLGNLDATYKHSTYPAVTAHTLTTGSRQRAGAMLLFGYTFAGRLWVSLGWDGGVFGGEGTKDQAGGIVWEGLGGEGEGGLRDRSKRSQPEGDGDERYGSGVGLVGCEGELGRWWREVVSGVGEFFGEE